jgi:hypothetical protein
MTTLVSFECCRESLRLTHGTRTSFVLSFSRNLGSVRLVNVGWQYDHDIDPLHPLKTCVLLLCSDSIYMQYLGLKSITTPSANRVQTS